MIAAFKRKLVNYAAKIYVFYGLLDNINEMECTLFIFVNLNKYMS